MPDRAWEQASMEVETDRTSARAERTRLLTRLFVVAALTMAVGYYLPLHRSHSALTAEQQTLRDENAALKRDLAAARTDLTAVSASRAELAAKDDRVTEDRAREKAQHDQALSGLRADLERRLDRKGSASVRDDRVVVSFEASATKGLDKGPASAVASRLGLCDVVAALQGPSSAREIEVVARVEESGASKWDRPARRAAKVADALGGTCHFAGGKVTASVRSDASEASSPLELSIDVAGGSAR
jgi:hypothetical protein